MRSLRLNFCFLVFFLFELLFRSDELLSIKSLNFVFKGVVFFIKVTKSYVFLADFSSKAGLMSMLYNLLIRYVAV